MRTIQRLVGASLLLAPLALAMSCAGTHEETATDDVNDTEAQDSGEPVASWDDARPIIEAHCSRCHSANRLSTYRRLETHLEVSALRSSILDKIETNPPRGLQMPLASNHTDTDTCTPAHTQINDKRLTEAEKDTLTAYLQRTDHLDYVDSHPPLVAPVVQELANSTAYTSSQFDVVNDGFLEHPDGADDGYMHDYGYDQRKYDQMEDDWFCISFDPGRTEAGYLTGLQALTESGQIYLNSQVVIDTTGESATARATAAESGSDWYRCDPGLGFSDAIPLWRTVPGGEAVELPEGTGLRFEPGWTFVLRAVFHTHYDAEEFDRLNQNGIIDRDAGTMTWFNRATLRATWASPQEIARELDWVTVEPTTQTERDAFAVAPGASTHTYRATVPADSDTEYAVFSAEVGMGKNGTAASLTESTGATCIASNGDFSPKWIEQAIYAEADAPRLSANSELELRCDYRNPTQDAVTWGPESEATVWGRKERCSAVVFYYELP
ncbi:MAG: hypothetical protein KC912_23525 [Proteobacteria bacterium]|nr:hypothetical protein [Pseudomonadota bacterium]